MSLNSTNKSTIGKGFLVFLGGLFLLSFVAICFVIAQYKKHFPGDYSLDQNVWGTFGDYVGGTLNPILAFLSFSALLITIFIQSKELNETRNEIIQSRKIATEQKNHFKREAQKNDLYKIINLIEEDIERILTFKSYIPGYSDTTLLYFLGNYALDEESNKIPDKTDEDNNPSIIKLAKSYIECKKYLKKLESLMEDKSVTDYFKRKYHRSVGILNTKKYIDKDTKQFFYSFEH